MNNENDASYGDETTRELGEIFLEALVKHLVQNEVVKLEGLGYFFVMVKQARIGINPLNPQQKVYIPTFGNYLNFYCPTNTFTRPFKGEKEFLASLVKNNIPLKIINFPKMSQILEQICPRDSAALPYQHRLMITNKIGEELLRITYRKKPRILRDANGEKRELNIKEMAIVGAEKTKSFLKSAPLSRLVLDGKSKEWEDQEVLGLKKNFNILKDLEKQEKYCKKIVSE